ncbi:tetratricopeptide repeat protein [filamentous cyanobacterium LEGE 11480]|uniref:Tetratricopeptide repeat protein n=1 Tax=Romeriopsis navalis LEGE 11480 TaxID=2777977 RepID=A0A928Z6D8_9CYAN|nr:tetratricopeptide repeat protein [Romeriopsis navalis]MBE9032135.1 tetratricopeptide repeat protein [Romeriopsis navalis LEGE 11480]
MTDLRERYSSLIETIVQSGLNGTVQSRSQVYDLIANEFEPATEAIFSDCLGQRINQTENQVAIPDALTQVRANRALRTLQTIQLEWQRYQAAVSAKDLVANTIFQITTAAPHDRLSILVDTLSPKQSQSMALPLLEQLARGLANVPCEPSTQNILQQYATGIEQGLNSWKAIDRHLVSWLYTPQQQSQSNAAKSPWRLWSMQPIGELPKQLFTALHHKTPLENWAADRHDFSLANWIETVLVLQRAQQGLIRWANQQPYNDQASKQLLSSLYLGFASTWVQLGQGLDRCVSLNSQNRRQFSHIALRLGLQFLQQFTQHPKFPLYGNAQHTPQNKSLCDALRYLSQPLNQLNAQAEKARILTVVGSLVVLSGKCADAEKLHQQALELAQATEDAICSIANLNHLSRIAAMQSQCSVAIEYAQRALITARQIGDAQGEANALMNLGTASARQAQLMEAPVREYEAAMDYLTEAIEKAQALGDEHCEGLCANALANLCINIGHPGEGLRWLQTGFKATTTCGDLYLQARHFTSMAEACKQVSHPGDAIYAACLGLYYFDQINWREWRQPAAVLTQLKQRLGQRFDQLLSQELAEIIRQIGAEGFAQITRRLEEYGQLENC